MLLLHDRFSYRSLGWYILSHSFCTPVAEYCCMFLFWMDVISLKDWTEILSFCLLLPSWTYAFRWNFYWNQIFLLAIPHVYFRFLSICILAPAPILYLLIFHPSFNTPFISLPLPESFQDHLKWSFPFKLLEHLIYVPYNSLIT